MSKKDTDAGVFLRRPDLPAEMAPEVALAKVLLDPVAQAAFTMRVAESFDRDVTPLVDELTDQEIALRKGDMSRVEATLLAQAHTLDMMFNRLLRIAYKQDSLPQIEAMMKFALKAQSQCRATLETLAEIKNPRSVAFVRQANIAAGPQQVNNGPVMNGGAVPRSEESQDGQSKLLVEKQRDVEWMDTGAPPTASGPHQDLEALVEIDRAEDAGRQGASRTKQLQGRPTSEAERAWTGAEATSEDALAAVDDFSDLV